MLLLMAATQSGYTLTLESCRALSWAPVFFSFFINDLPKKISLSVTLVADDYMLYNQVEKPEDAEQLQQDLDTLRNWENTWWMEFNVEKWK